MSVIRKKPFIEEVVDLLTISQKEALLSVMNTAGNNVPASLLEMPEKGIKPVLFKFDEANIKTGILIYLDGVPVTLIAYHRFQDVLLFRLYPNEDRYEKVNEYCDINELRRILGVGNEVTAGEIISGLTEKNKVLTADGEGGAFWDDKVNYLVLTGESGTLTVEQLAVAQLDSAVAQLGDNGKLYYKESQSNYYIVFSASPLVSGDTTYIEKITVNVTDRTWSYEAQAIAAGEGFNPEYDNALSDASTNAVQNKVITEALDDKANVDGNYQTMTVGLANNFDSKLVENDKSAYNFRPTASMGSVELEVGSPCKVKKIVGGTVAFNQLASALNNSNYYAQNGSATYSDGVATFTASAQWGNLGTHIEIVEGHKYLASINIKLTSASQRVLGILVIGDHNYDIGYLTGSTDWNSISTIISVGTITGSSTRRLQLGDTAASDFAAIQIKEYQIFDLTQMFGATIADYIYTLESGQAGAGVAWFKRYFNKDYYAYNAGQLVSVKTSGKKITHFNQWDEEWENKRLRSTGLKEADAGWVCSKNPVPVFPNTQYELINKGNYSNNTLAVCEYDINNNFIRFNKYVNDENGWSLTTSSTARYLQFGSVLENAMTSYTGGICLHFAYDGERDGEYEPYDAETYAIEDVELRGVPKLNSNNNLVFDGDEYNSNGNVSVRYSVVDLGSLTWEQGSYGWYSDDLTDVKIVGYDVMPNLICNKYETVQARPALRLTEGTITLNNSSTRLWVNNGSTETKPTGTLIYELATPTTDNAEAFTETQECDNWGTEQFLAPANDSRPCEVPVGNDTDYLPDLKAKLETAPTTPNSDGYYVLEHNSDGNGYTELGAVLSAAGYAPSVIPTLPTTAGKYRLCVTIADGQDPVYSWESEE